MSTRVKRLHRVTAVIPDGMGGTYTERRDYQTLAAAENRAKGWREGAYYPATNYEAEDYTRPPALSVTIVSSDPITWPEP